MTSTFALSLTDLETLANRDLTELAGIMGQVTPALTSPQSFGPTGADPLANGVHHAYVAHIEILASRQRRMCEAIAETAEALREIIALYRRADGQE